jgi:hypothetical protein
MKERFSRQNEPVKKTMRESLGVAALAGTLLFSHGEARAFDIAAGSDFETGIGEVRQGTRNDDAESDIFLIVEPRAGQEAGYVWAKSGHLSTPLGGVSTRSDTLSEDLRGIVPESGEPLSAYYLHSHNASLPIEGIDPAKKVYSVPPGGDDVLSMLSRTENQTLQHGSRPITVKYAVSDSAGVWFLDKIPTDTVQRSPLAIVFMIEGNKNEGALHKWIEANAFEGDVPPADVEAHTRSVRDGELYAALQDAYKKVGVTVRYTLWSDIGKDDFPLVRDAAK